MRKTRSKSTTYEIVKEMNLWQELRPERSNKGKRKHDDNVRLSIFIEVYRPETRGQMK